MTQQHQDPLLGLDKLRMAQLALALETVEALAQRVISTESGSASTGQPPISTRSLDWRRRKPTRVQSTVLVELDGQPADPAIGAGLTAQHGLQRRRLDVAEPLEQADQAGLLGGALIRFGQVLGAAAAALAVVAAEGAMRLAAGVTTCCRAA